MPLPSQRGGRTITRCTEARPLIVSILSPRPRQMAGFDFRKNGTSLPISAATSASRCVGQFRLQARLAATSAAAASLDPPPNPAAAGIRLTSCSFAPRSTPARSASKRTARTARFFSASGRFPIALPLGMPVWACGVLNPKPQRVKENVPGVGFQNQGVVQTDRNHESFNLMESIVAPV